MRVEKFKKYLSVKHNSWIRSAYRSPCHGTPIPTHTHTHPPLMAWRSNPSPLPLPLLLFLVSLLLPIAIRGAEARSISRPVALGSDPSLSDGIDTAHSHSHSRSRSVPLLRLLPRSEESGGFRASEEGCEQTYGFLPCTTTVVGNLFLVVVYGFLMFKAATYLSAGSEMLLEILGPGIVGGLFLPILGALPDAMLIFGRFRPPILVLRSNLALDA